MAKKSKITFGAVIQSILGLFFFLNLIISLYIVIAPDSVKHRDISDISYGPVRVSGEITGTSYGQVNFSTVNLTDGTGSITILFGLYKNIEDPVKAKRRRNMKDVSGMKKEEAIKKLNEPVHYKGIEVVGIYYPYVSLVHAYFINGKITIVEYLMISMYLIMTFFFFYSVMVSIMARQDENRKR
jgi:hypothetical protein